MTRWLSRNRWRFVYAARMTAASVAAYASAYLLGLPEGLWAVVAAIVVVQSNVGGSLKAAFEQFAGSVFGGVYAAAVALAMTPSDPLSSALALTVALAPPSVLAASSRGFRIAPITAAIVLLAGPGLHLDPVGLATHRILEVGLGCGVGLLVAVLVAPARASRMVVETSSRTAGLLAEQLEALACGDAAARADLGSRAAEIRDGLVTLATYVEEAAHERRARLTDAPDGMRLLRTLRRVRHDVDVLRRAARDADVLQDPAASSWQRAAETGASTLADISRLLAGQRVPEDVDTLTPSVRAYRAALDEMRRDGLTRSLSTAALGRLFGIGYALEQLQRNLADLIEVSREASGRAARAPVAPEPQLAASKS